jgi:thymidylate kinase
MLINRPIHQNNDAHDRFRTKREELRMKILITGMSGTGKSTVLNHLKKRGHQTVDTDSDEWSCWVTAPNGFRDWIWREDAIREMLSGHSRGRLFVAGCKSNQGKFYPLFDHVVLLSAPTDVLMKRIAERTNNPYGKFPAERQEILRNIKEVEPMLRATATAEFDTSAPIYETVAHLENLE